MKKLLLPLMLLTVSGMTWAQSNTKTKPAVKTNSSKPVAQQSALKNLNDSASYAIGVSVASFYRQQGITSLNTSLVTRAINDILSGKKALMDDEAASMCVNKLLNNMQETKSKPTIEAGEAFLAKNRARPEVKSTASGLQYEVITEGTGVKPTSADSVTCHYRGTYIDGREFDASYNHGGPITFALGGVIRGWTEGLQLMPVGSKYKFYVPYSLAYGPMDYNGIPGGSTLIFEVELIDVKKVK
jgi:FKBP-type peptidyl-prolyl cis-trans isomerase FklB